jgi:hypothetical protein
LPPAKNRASGASIHKLLSGPWRATLLDPLEFISRLKIIDKKGVRVNLIPNQEQIEIVQALEEEDEDLLILKGRQIGSSTIIVAWLFWKSYVSTEPTTLATMSHKTNSARHLLGIIKNMHDTLPKALQRGISVDNGTELRFADTGAGVIAVSAEGKGGLRSFSCNALHISEFAFADNPEELKATAIAALNGGKMVMESTANHWGDGVQQEWMRAEKGEAEWRRLFFPWFAHKAYTLPIPLDDEGEPLELEWRPDEEALQARYDLADGQLLWRRQRIGKLGLEKFRREFPASPEEAYTVAGSTFFHEEDFTDVEIITTDDYHWSVFEEPHHGDAYAVGVDVAAGIGRDYSVIFVMSKMTGSPCAVWRSNRTEPTTLAEQIIDIAVEYNYAHVLVESNNFGGIVLNQMRHEGWRHFWKSSDGKDWVTSAKTKAQIFEGLRTKLTRSEIRHIDRATYDELRAITVSERGTIELQRNEGAHSDSAMSLALACQCLDKVKLPEINVLPDWIKQRRVDRIILNHGASCGPTRRYS